MDSGIAQPDQQNAMMGPGGKTSDVGEVKILCDQEPACLARVLPYHVIILPRDALREDGVDIMP